MTRPTIKSNYTKEEVKEYTDNMKNEEMKTIKKIIKARNNDKIENTEDHEDYREPLSIEQFTELTILLSWGGPSNGFKLLVDKDGDVTGGKYFFSDWFEYQESKLTIEEAEQVADLYFYGDVQSYIKEQQ